ncbi:hypothetical protein [Francisella halioticida]|nr:hypothetical protein [Francisella halioticida]
MSQIGGYDHIAVHAKRDTHAKLITDATIILYLFFMGLLFLGL